MVAQPVDLSLLNKYGLDIEETLSLEHDYDVLPIHISITECIDNVVAYISGYVIKMCSRRINCDFCINALIDNKITTRGHQHFELLVRKDRGSTHFISFISCSLFYIFRRTSSAISGFTSYMSIL